MRSRILERVFNDRSGVDLRGSLATRQTAVRGGERSFADPTVNGEVAPIAVVRRTSVTGGIGRYRSLSSQFGEVYRQPFQAAPGSPQERLLRGAD
jgi:hypothetical protein